MRFATLKVFFRALSVAGLIMAAGARADRTVPVAFAFPAEDVVIVDGFLDEECWRKATPVGSFVRLTDNAQFAVPRTTFSVVYDRNALYFGIRADEPESARVTLQKFEHDAWPSGSSMEFFLDPNQSRHSYYQLAANLAGSRYDSYMTDKKAWDANWRCVTQVGESGWTMEAGIPFADFGVVCPEKGSVWGLNLCRNREGGLQNSSTWAHVGSFFHNPGAFNTLIFGGPEDFLNRQLTNQKRMSLKVHEQLVRLPKREIAIEVKLNYADVLLEELARPTAAKLSLDDAEKFLRLFADAREIQNRYAAIAEELEAVMLLHAKPRKGVRK